MAKTNHTSPNPSQNAMRAQAEMFRLLQDKFNPDEGRYEEGWDDNRIAKECELSPAMVREFRRAGFGEITRNPDIDRLRQEIADLRKLCEDELNGLQSRLAAIEAGM